ncbi:MAG: hypothetical protein EBX52_04045 [Proteobacteria bacterium]|nr:hypothetical protein [Pseudomonadota bacterium]
MLLLWSNLTLASPLCHRDRSAWVLEFLDPANRIAFRNHGGLVKGGVCWWHSRLQRSAIYLSEFAPEKPVPSEAAARTLIRHLVRFDSVVTLPGYSNFHDFSRDFEPLIQKELEAWQIRDGFLYQQWIRGLYGRPSMPAATLKRRMDTIYSRFVSSKPGLWIMAQLPGITSHALLLIGMDKKSDGYRMRVIDSNRPDSNRDLVYTEGDHAIQLESDSFTPFAGFQTDQEEIDETLEDYCSDPGVPARRPSQRTNRSG